MGKEVYKAISHAKEKLDYRARRGTDLHPGKVPFDLSLSGSVVPPHQLIRDLCHNHNGYQ